MNVCAAMVIWVRILGLCVLIAQGVRAGDATEAESRILELRAEIAHHDELYFKKAAPEISDAAYDRLKRELRDLEADYPQYAAPSAGVGDDRTGDFAQAAHAVPMRSLDKVYDETELRRWLADAMQRLGGEQTEWVVEPKYDGLAISLIYANGRLVRAVTRGNGRVGDEVTANVRGIDGVVENLGTGFPEQMELRGEIYLTHAEFARINARREADGLEPYAHPRNLAAGTLKQTDGENPGQRRLSLVLYGWGEWQPAATRPKSQVELSERLHAWGLPAVGEFRRVGGADEAWAAVREFKQRREQWPFPVDGVVLKLNPVALREVLGDGAGAPNWAVAYKYPPDTAMTRITAIVLQVGRTGVVTPVAEFEPVVLGGATIARASLHNRGQIDRLDLRVGDWVEVEKAGEIIPQVARVLVERRAGGLERYAFPAECPVCQEPLFNREDEAITRCLNRACPAQLQLRLAHFASAQGVDIRGLGPGLIGRLIDAGAVTRPGDFFRLDAAQLAPVVGEKTAAKLLAEIAHSRRAELPRVITGLGIPGIGPAAAAVLAAHFKSLGALARAEASAVDAAVVPGLWPSAAQAMQSYLAEPENRQSLEDLAGLGLGQAVEAAQTGPRAGKRLVLTGKLPGLTRKQAADLIQSAGGEVGEAVTPTTDYVVAGENAGAKLDEAQRRGIPVVDEARLRELAGQAP